MSELVEIVRAVAREGLENIAEEIKTDMVANAPVSKSDPSHAGYLRDHIKIVKVTDFAYFIGTDDVDYAKYADSGRGEVRPKRKKALKFDINGKTIITKYASPYSGSHYVRNTAKRWK